MALKFGFGNQAWDGFGPKNHFGKKGRVLMFFLPLITNGFLSRETFIMIIV